MPPPTSSSSAQEVGDVEDVGEQVEELGRGQGPVQLGDRLGEGRGVGHLDLPLLVDGLEGPADLGRLLEGREGGEDPLGEGLLEEVVDAEVGDRRGGPDPFAEGVSVDGIDVVHGARQGRFREGSGVTLGGRNDSERFYFTNSESARLPMLPNVAAAGVGIGAGRPSRPRTGEIIDRREAGGVRAAEALK